MKILGLVILCLLFLGCATSVPKEELRDIFTLVKEEKFEAAEKKLEESASKSLVGRYSTYTGESIYAYQTPYYDDVFALISGAKASINACNEIINRLQKLSPHRPNSEDQMNFHDEFESLQNDFVNNCKASSQQEFSTFSKIRRYSSVDLSPILNEMDLIFVTQVERIKVELDQIEKRELQRTTDEKAKQELYESSPEFYSKKLCEFADRINLAKTVIQREGEAGKISGYVNKQKLYEAGKVVQINQDYIKRFGGEYRSKFGKSWDASSCK